MDIQQSGGKKNTAVESHILEVILCPVPGMGAGGDNGNINEQTAHSPTVIPRYPSSSPR